MTIQTISQKSGSEPLLSPAETVAYSKDMLIALRNMAVRHEHHCLAELLAGAVAETERILGSGRVRQSASRK